MIERERPVMPQPVSDALRREIEHDCTMLMHRYAVNADQHIDRFFEVFTPDALWVRPGMEMRGHAEIQAFMDNMAKSLREANPHGHLTRHLMTTMRIDVVDADKAEGVTYALVFREENFAGTVPVAMNQIELVVEYRDIFVRTPNGWLIDRHEAQHVFRR